MNPPYIPATALGGDLVRDWTGPIEVRVSEIAGLSEWVESCYCLSTQAFLRIERPEKTRLDPRRPEVAHRVADVLRAKGHEVGPLLPVALGGRVAGAIADRPCPCGGQGVEVGPDARGCADCGLRGTVRTLVPAADVSALLLCASVAGVEAGAGVVRVKPAWEERDPAYLLGFRTYTAHWQRALDVEVVCVDGAWKWRCHDDWHDCETGPEGRKCADAALLRLGFAYLDPSAPFGVVAPFLTP